MPKLQMISIISESYWTKHGKLDYRQFLVVTEYPENELGVEISAYPLLAKQTPYEIVMSGYFQRLGHFWSEVDNHLTEILLSVTVSFIP